MLMRMANNKLSANNSGDKRGFCAPNKGGFFQIASHNELFPSAGVLSQNRLASWKFPILTTANYNSPK